MSLENFPDKREEQIPWLNQLASRVEALEKSVATVESRQTGSPGSEPAPTSHGPGLCQNPDCEACAKAAQVIAKDEFNRAKQSISSNIEAALTWYGGPEAVTEMHQVLTDWVNAGRPMTGRKETPAGQSVTLGG